MKRSTQYVLIFTHVAAAAVGAWINSAVSTPSFTSLSPKIQKVIKSEFNAFNSKFKKSLNALENGNIEDAKKYCVDAEMIADTLKRENMEFKQNFSNKINVLLAIIDKWDQFDLSENRLQNLVSSDFFKDIDEGYTKESYVSELNGYLFDSGGFLEYLEAMRDLGKQLSSDGELEQSVVKLTQGLAGEIYDILNNWMQSASELNRKSILNEKGIISNTATTGKVLTGIMTAKARFQKGINSILR